MSIQKTGLSLPLVLRAPTNFMSHSMEFSPFCLACLVHLMSRRFLPLIIKINAFQPIKGIRRTELLARSLTFVMLVVEECGIVLHYNCVLVGLVVSVQPFEELGTCCTDADAFPEFSPIFREVGERANERSRTWSSGARTGTVTFKCFHFVIC